MLRAHDLVERHEAGKTAGQHHRNYNETRRRHAAIGGSQWICTKGTQFIAQFGSPDQDVKQATTDQGPEKGYIEAGNVKRTAPGLPERREKTADGHVERMYGFPAASIPAEKAD